MRTPLPRIAAAAALVLLVAMPARPGDEPPAAQPAGAAAPDPFWTADELARIDEGLAVVNASRADLGFQKQPIDDPFRLDVVRRALDDPLSVGREAQVWDEVARRGDAHWLLAQAQRVFPVRWGGGDRAFTDVPCDEVVELLGAGTKEPLRRVLDSSSRAARFPRLVRQDTNESLPSDASILVKALRSQVETAAVHVAAAEMADGDFLAAVQRVNFEVYFEDASAAIQATRALVAALRASVPAFVGRREFATAVGRIVVYGTGDDVHPADETAVLVIDLGGNDTYHRGASANLLEERPAQIVIDLSGDDRYVGGSDFSCGGALGGVAIHWDCAGNDVYQAGHCSLGAGILGVGVLVDEGGDDVFRARDFCEGAGAFGIGVLLKKGGNDLYHADLFGQGFASTWGCGVLADLSGNDTYDAGGAHVHAPLFRDRYQSLSQGFSIGARPSASGGVGVLVDASGNDRYVADIYAQGSSYWYSLGLLIDDDGHDTYVAGQYSIGSGIHLSAGMLLDRAGNDSYHCLNGVGVGGAHDFAVGFLVDRGGDDHYSGSGGSQGGALTNSVAMLLDDAGDDGYCAVRGGSQGVATAARGTGGIGLLLDGGGKDVYSEETRNAGLWVKDTVGAGIDQPSETAASGEPQAATISQADAEARVEERGKVVLNDGSRAWDLERLWTLASEWEVNDNRVIVPIARARLWDLGAPALDRAFERLGSGSTGSGLEFRAVEATVRHFAASDGRASVVARLLERTRDADVTVRKGAVSLLGSLKAEEGVARLAEMLDADLPVRRQVLGALGALKRAPPGVAALLRGRSELEGVGAAACLGAAGDEASVAALLGSIGADTPYLVRIAATEQLGALGEASIGGLCALVRDSAADTTARRNALRAVARTGHPDGVDAIVESFLSGSAWIRLSAMLAAPEYAKRAKDVDRREVEKSLDAARAMESDPLVQRLVP